MHSQAVYGNQQGENFFEYCVVINFLEKLF